MKRVLGLLIIVSLLGSALAYFLSPAFATKVDDLYTFSFCDKPQSYKIGTIDERFDLTKDELLLTTRKAAQVWSEAYGKDLFINDETDGEIVINLSFDERQELTNQIGKLHQELDAEKNTITPQIADFENRVSQFKARVAALNSKIEYWNSKGGAPQNEFEALFKEQQSLKEEQGVLDEMASKLNRSTNVYNSQVGNLNETIDTFNTTLKTRPEEGLYNGQDDTITIFFMSSTNELMHTLTHEFGHALTIEHLPEKEAIMFYQTNDSLSLSKSDKEALLYACRDRNIFDLATERAILLGRNVEDIFQKYDLIP